MARYQVIEATGRADEPPASFPPSYNTAQIEQLRTLVTCEPGEHVQIPVRAPWTGEVIGSVPHCDVADVQLAGTRARAAQRRWAALSYRQRAEIVLRFHDLLLARQNTILDLMQLETGKARKHAIEEVLDTANVARHYAFHGERHIRSRRRRGAFPLLTTAWEHHHPRGVVGVIAPWNYPLTLAISDALPALLAGNAVVLKPDSQTPFTALSAVSLLYEAGLPRDIYQVVTGDGPITGPLLIDAVDYVTFTGSTATGRIVARQAAERLIGCSLELGGKNAMVVLPDADLDRTVAGAIHGCFASTGQLCISIERLYVHASIYERFAKRFVAATRRLRVGPGFRYHMDMGSLVSHRQLDTVVEHVEDAIAGGAHHSRRRNRRYAALRRGNLRPCRRTLPVHRGR
jgi:acyl-CoA reductase-like NAD-dependent aldehyde dehydrogenase